MRQLTKLTEPPTLRDNGAEWAAAYVESNAATAPWRHTEIKLQLQQETGGRCAYCEGAILAVSFGEIEHIRPRSKFPNLVVRWDNLTLACSRCNGKKSDKWDDQLPFVNPYVDEIAKHIFFVGSTAYSRSERGNYTIRELDLNGPARVEAREAEIRNLAAVLERYEKAEADYSREQFRILINELISGGEYSAALRSFAFLHSRDSSRFSVGWEEAHIRSS